MEITESQTSAHPTEPRIAVDEALPPRRSSVRRYASEVGPFLAVVVQFGLIVLVVGHWQLESRLLTRLLWLAFGGFIIHHLLPVRFRLSLGHRLIADKLYEPLVRLLFASPTKQQASRFQKP